MRLRTSALGGLVLIAALVVPAGASAAATVTGYPRCNLEGTASDYTWWSNDENVAITAEPILEWEGSSVAALEVDCSAALECLFQVPEMAGRAATIVGSNAADVLIGTAGPDVIVGAGGADQISGAAGRDILCGGPDDDVLRGGRADDFLFGGGGADELRGGGRRDMLDGGDGADALFGGKGADTLRGRSGRDALYGDRGDDRLRGGSARDVCFGGPGSDGFSGCGVAAQDEIQYGSGPLRAFRVQIDPLLDESLALTTAYVDWILSDGRSWIGGEEVTWQRVGASQPADLTITLAAPATVDAICAPLRTGGYFSCRNGDRIGINVNRWNGATDWWPASLHTYRTYVINHEVGHFLGHGHASCPGAGEWADVMQQQTKRLDGCVANGWVYPKGQP